MKRDVDPVKIIKILPVPRSSGKPPFLQPGWLTKLREQLSAATAALRVRMAIWRRRLDVSLGAGSAGHPPSASAPSASDVSQAQAVSGTAESADVSVASLSESPQGAADCAVNQTATPAKLPPVDEATTMPTTHDVRGHDAPVERVPNFRRLQFEQALERLRTSWERERERMQLRVREGWRAGRARMNAAWLAGRHRLALLQAAASQRLDEWHKENQRRLRAQRERTRVRATRTVAAVRGAVSDLAASRRGRVTTQQQLATIQQLMERQQDQIQRLSEDLAAQRHTLEELAKQLAGVTNRTHTAARGPAEGSGSARGRVVKRNGEDAGAQSRAPL